MVVLAQNREGRRVDVAGDARLVGTELLTARRLANCLGYLAGHAQAAVALGTRALVLFTEQGYHRGGLEAAGANVSVARAPALDRPPRHRRREARGEPLEP